MLNKLPNVAVIVREGARNLDPGLDEMARAYRFDRRTWAMDVLVPQLQPYVVTAARSGLSLAWKIVLVVELLGVPTASASRSTTTSSRAPMSPPSSATASCS